MQKSGQKRQVYECLQDWVQHVKQMVTSKVNSLRETVESQRHGILDLNSVKECLKELQEKYPFVPADKDALLFGGHLQRAWSVAGHYTYIPETMDPKETSGNYVFYMKSLGFKEDDLSDKFPIFYWTPKLHKTPYKHRFIASSFDCITKLLSVLLTRILSAIKGKLSNLSSVIYSRTGINDMWILKNSSELLKKMNNFHYPKVTSIQTFGVSSDAEG